MLTILLLAAAVFAPVDASRVSEIERMLAAEPVLPGPAPTERAAWDGFATDLRNETLVAEAESAAATPPPALSDELYREYNRTGNRSHYEKPYFRRLDRLQRLTLAECFTWKGKYLPAIRRDLRAILDEKCWCVPAHDGGLRAFRGEQTIVDLFASERAWGVALTVRLLKGKLGDELEQEALDRVRARAVDPYLAVARGKASLDECATWWVRCDNNWNRVCNAGCCSSALLVCDSRRERAEAIALAELGLKKYLGGFSDDGYCEEGIGYWNYGFGNHILLGLYVRAVTRGRVDFFADTKNRAIATYPVRIALDETRQAPLFADANERSMPRLLSLCAAIWPQAYIPGAFYASADVFDCGGSSSWPSAAMFLARAFGPQPLPSVNDEKGFAARDWFDDAGVLVSRTADAAFAAAMKPLNRGFSHSHADAGSYALADDGKMLAGDCGGEKYTSRTFSKRRFESKILNSYGHPVPVVDGQLQRPQGVRTKILSKAFTPTRDTLVVDLKSAYPKATNLVALTRTFVFDRAARTFAVTDAVKFAVPSAFETAIVTLEPKVLEGRYDIAVTGGEWTKVVETLENRERLSPTRIGIRLTRPVRDASVTVTFRAHAVRTFSKNIYLDLMERAVNAYSPEHAASFTEANARDGVSEHGFPRLTANLGILIAHGRLTARKAEFKRMMDICCRDVRRKMPPGTGGGNDFSVKELVFTLDELERAKTFPERVIETWRMHIVGAVANDIYTCLPEIGIDSAHNWCVFGAASEQARFRYAMGGDVLFVEKYLSDQMRFFDANGMYKDPHQPMVYDFVTRLQFAAALSCGYDGPSSARLRALMDKAMEPTLKMQSVTGEIPYGGRSNQFLHNETFYAALCEWYARTCHAKGDVTRARRFRAAARRAVRSLDYWLAQKDVRHVKNRYPMASGYGCEGYAYFDKYMVTMGSWAYLAYRFADETIEPTGDCEPDSTFVTSDAFHRVMMNVGDYTAEFDWAAQKGYDANGLGRFQRRGAPPMIALATPFPIKPHYRLDVTNDSPLAIGPVGWKGGRPVSAETGRVVFRHGDSTWTTRLTKDGLKMTLVGKGRQVLTIPAFLFNGARETRVTVAGRKLSVAFDGWQFVAKTNGKIADTGKVYGNRSGHSRRYDFAADGELTLTLAIQPLKQTGAPTSDTAAPVHEAETEVEERTAAQPTDAAAMVTISAGDDWIPFTYHKNIAAGSALDFSQMRYFERPAGCHGRVIVKDGHYAFADSPDVVRRFWGCNLNMEAIAPEADLAVEVAERLARTGYNAVRIHHHDALLTKGTSGAGALNEANMKRFDFFVAELVKRGIYLETDLFVSRKPLRWRDIGIDLDGEAERYSRKALMSFYAPAYSNWCAFARNFLTHRNPYLGKTVAELPWINVSLINEGRFVYPFPQLPKLAPFQEKWRAWIATKRAADPTCYPELGPKPWKYPKVEWKDQNAGTIPRAPADFCADLERAFVARARPFLASLGLKAPLSNQNNASSYVAQELVCDEVYDTYDIHAYGGGQGKDSFPRPCSASHPFARATFFDRIGRTVFARPWSSPVTITEWNYGWPNAYRPAGTLKSASLAALQDWGAIFRFAYAHGLKHLQEGVFKSSRFDVGLDYSNLASERLAFALFTRRDLPALATRGVIELDDAARATREGWAQSVVSTNWSADAAWTAAWGVSSPRQKPAGCRTVKLSTVLKDGLPRLGDWPKGVTWDAARGAFSVATPYSAAASAPSGKVAVGPLVLDLPAAATAFVLSLDGKPFADSTRLLFSALPDIQFDGITFTDATRTTMTACGNYSRPLVRRVRVSVALTLNAKAAYDVWELATDGRRVRSLPVTRAGDALSFIADTKGAKEGVLNWEIVRK